MPANDDIRDLMGRYATGTLSDAERRRLFDAALEDQDLFDELAREHSLKQLIDSPGVRDRLLANLAPPEPARSAWKKNLAWALAAAFVIGMSLTAVVIMRNSLRQPQFAKLETPAAAPTPAPAAQPAAPEIAIDSKPSPKAARTSSAAKTPSASDSKTARAEAQSVAQPAAASTENGALADRKQPPAAAPAAVGADKLEKNKPAAPQPLQARPIVLPPPPPQPSGFRPSASPPTVPAPAPVVAPIQAAPPATASGGGGGRGAPARAFGTIAGLAAANRPTEAKKAEARKDVQVQAESAQVETQPARTARQRTPAFSLEYSVEDQDIVCKFARDGYFSIHFTPGQDTIVDSRVTAGATRRERMPNNTTEIYITFSAQPQSDSGGIKVTATARADTLTDPSGKRIELMIRLYP